MSTPAPSALKLTYEDYLYFPEDGKRHEIIEGDHYVTPAPNTRHQIVSQNLSHSLSTFVREQRLGRVFTAPFDVVLSETDVVQPDLLFLANQSLARLGELHLEGPPDLVVEIVSEGTRKRDEVTKRHLYERYGVPEYWIVDPVVETVKVYRRDADGAFRRMLELARGEAERLDTPLLKGLMIELDDLFE